MLTNQLEMQIMVNAKNLILKVHHLGTSLLMNGEEQVETDSQRENFVGTLQTVKIDQTPEGLQLTLF